MAYTVGSHGNRIFYRTTGESGPHVVLVQGLGLSGSFWFGLPQILARAPKSPQRVIVLDNRGTGGTDLPIRPWRIGHMADDIVAVLDAEGVESAVAVGISMGGMIVQHLALRHPDRVDGLVLMATTAGLPHVRLPRLRVVLAILKRSFLGVPRDLDTLGKILLPKSHFARRHALLAQWPRLIERESAGHFATLCQLAAILGHSTGFKLHRIRCPTAIVTSAEDALVPPQNSEFLAKRIPFATLEKLKNVAHGIQVLDERAVCRAIARVRQQIEARRNGGSASEVAHEARARLRVVRESSGRSATAERGDA